jgi:hypothetical protein
MIEYYGKCRSILAVRTFTSIAYLFSNKGLCWWKESSPPVEVRSSRIAYRSPLMREVSMLDKSGEFMYEASDKERRFFRFMQRSETQTKRSIERLMHDIPKLRP